MRYGFHSNAARPAMKTRLLSLLLLAQHVPAAPLSKTVLYVTQTPIPDEVLSSSHVLANTRINVTTTMQSPLADPQAAPRGGALWIRYANGTRRNLTSAAGFGGPVDANGNATGFQGANSIAVQRPFLHWSWPDRGSRQASPKRCSLSRATPCASGPACPRPDPGCL